MYVQFSRTGISNRDLVALESQISLVDSYLVHSRQLKLTIILPQCQAYRILLASALYQWYVGSSLYFSYVFYFVYSPDRVLHYCSGVAQMQSFRPMAMRAALPLGGAPRRRHITNRGAGPSIIMHCGLAQRRDSTDVGRTNFPVWAKLLCVLCAIFCFVYNCQFVLSTTVLWCAIGCFLVKLPS